MRKQILAYLKGNPPQRLLWLSGQAPKDAPEDCHLTHVADPADLAPEAQFDCAVIEELPDSLDKPGAEAMIAQLRDVRVGRLLWLQDADSPWTEQEMLALGFRHLDHAGDKQLYGYDIDNYKVTPDWLNPKNWANPGQWNKKRW